MLKFRPAAPLVGALLLAATTGLVHCSSGEGVLPDASDDDITGVNNSLGLGLVYDNASHHLRATLRAPLGEGESLRIRVRRGVITHESQDQLDCNQLAEAPPLPPTNVAGRVVYDGPVVSEELVGLISIYDDERWYGGHQTAAMNEEIAKGPDSIVEACVMKGGAVRARLLTNLAYAWTRQEDLDEAAATSHAQGVHIQADPVGSGGARIAEGRRYNTIDYARLCEQELGEIPFFKKISEGKYSTFDCRDFTSSSGNGPEPMPGVESRIVPLTVDGEERTKCDPGRGRDVSYDCVNKCDHGMFVTASSMTGYSESSCQPGVTVSTAQNSQGTQWILLCRKVQDTGDGVMRSKKFNDIAIIGNDPKTGRTCFLQNKEDVGTDGSRIPHPADVARSSAMWPARPQSYCSGNCHGPDAFIHSPWLDGARRADGTAMVPKMGEHPLYPVSDVESPYSVVNGPAQGFKIPQQLVSEEVSPCTTCHRVAGKAFVEFAEFSVGKNSRYFSKITASHSRFPEAFWMPPRLEGITADTWPQTRWASAVKHMRDCFVPESGTPPRECLFADIPSSRPGSGELPPAGPIPEATLRDVDTFVVTSEALNCRSGPGTANAIVKELPQGQELHATEEAGKPRVAPAPDGRLWLLVHSGDGAACYASAQYQFIAPRQ